MGIGEEEWIKKGTNFKDWDVAMCTIFVFSIIYNNLFPV